jgi:hypothetical protein
MSGLSLLAGVLRCAGLSLGAARSAQAADGGGQGEAQVCVALKDAEGHLRPSRPEADQRWLRKRRLVAAAKLTAATLAAGEAGSGDDWRRRPPVATAGGS